MTAVTLSAMLRRRPFMLIAISGVLLLSACSGPTEDGKLSDTTTTAAAVTSTTTQADANCIISTEQAESALGESLVQFALPSGGTDGLATADWVGCQIQLPPNQDGSAGNNIASYYWVKVAKNGADVYAHSKNFCATETQTPAAVTDTSGATACVDSQGTTTAVVGNTNNNSLFLFRWDAVGSLHQLNTFVADLVSHLQS